jgi:16S rRNA (guanine527-N7)-methyltransferase
MDRLARLLTEWDIPYNSKTMETFQQYMRLVLDWNKKINLTTITDPERFVERHFVDSIACCGWREVRTAQTIVDVGTGAGFPGVPLAIVWPDKEFLLIDARRKRIRVLDEILTILSLKNIKTIHGRAEDLARMDMYREAFDLCVSRAVANLAVLVEYGLPFVRIGGWMLAYKGTEIEKEADAATNAIALLGGRLARTYDVVIPSCSLQHKILSVEKIAHTVETYPRHAGQSKKNPL